MLGQAVQDFRVATPGGTSFSLADGAGRPRCSIFSPNDDIPGCTTEGHRFRDAHEDFPVAGAVLAGVSPDSMKSHESFGARMGFPFVMLACRRAA
ncbi:MAG: redoxin domain-containing protein [Casimicrobiaceae bacterium]